MVFSDAASCLTSHQPKNSTAGNRPLQISGTSCQVVTWMGSLDLLLPSWPDGFVQGFISSCLSLGSNDIFARCALDVFSKILFCKEARFGCPSDCKWKCQVAKANHNIKFD